MLKCSQIWPDTWFKFFIGTLSTAISQVPSNCLCVANIFVLAYILFYIIIYLYKIYKNYRHKQRTAEAQKKGQLILMSSDSFMTREGKRKDVEMMLYVGVQRPCSGEWADGSLRVTLGAIRTNPYRTWSPILSPFFFQPHWPPFCFSNTPKALLPQGLCTCPIDSECSSFR